MNLLLQCEVCTFDIQYVLQTHPEPNAESIPAG